MMRRGDVVEALLSPVEGSEQDGKRPVIVVSLDAINRSSPVVIVVPCTTYRGQRVFPSQILIRRPDGNLTVDSVALGEQLRAISKTRIVDGVWGSLAPQTLRDLEDAIRIALDLSKSG
jgi:mRNA interferase MazF